MSIKTDNDMPEDKNISSGDSFVWRNMVKIDNYASVKDYFYKNKKKDRLKKHQKILTDKQFHFWEEIDIFDEEVSLEKSNISNSGEYPQGLCITDEFVFISSYSDIYGKLGKIKVFDRNSGEFLLSLGMDENSHLGGLTYDGNYIWVCNSSKMSIERISYPFIKQMVNVNRGNMIDARNLVDIFRVKNIPSCVTYNDGYLWVTTHSIWTNATMVGYQLNKEGERLNSFISYWVPPKVQGVTFSKEGDVYLSTSYGRKNSSYIKKYNSLYEMSKDVNEYTERIELPPCSEGVVYMDKQLYVLFESAGKKYLEGTDGKGKTTSPIDKILVIED